METLLDILVARCSNVPLCYTPSITTVGIAEVDEYVGDCDLALLNSCISINIFWLGKLPTP